jgi:3-oxoacyl-(acyl-carrier-protein) synthase
MTSTIAGDETEAQAILDANPNGIIFALKSITDHSFAAAGAVNIAIATQFLRDQMLPEQINLIQRGTRKGDHIDPGALSQVIFSDRSHAGPRKIETVAVHGIGMQGIIYVGVIRKYDQAFQL